MTAIFFATKSEKQRKYVYRRTRRPSISYLQEHGLDLSISCQIKASSEWKLDLMAAKVFEHLTFDKGKTVKEVYKILSRCMAEEKTVRISRKAMLTGCAGRFENCCKPELNEKIDKLIEDEHLFRTSGGCHYLVDRVSALRQNDSDRRVFATLLNYLREKVSGDEGYLDQYVKILKDAGMSVSYNKNALWQKLEQDIHEDFYQEYYPKQSLFHREKVWLEDVRELNGEIVEKVAKALLKYETKWLGKLEEELRREEELERQSQQLLAGKRKKADDSKTRKSTLEVQKAVLEKAREHIVEEIRQDRENLEDYRRIAKEAYTEQYAGIVRRIRQTLGVAEKTKLVLLLGLLEEDYKATMGGCQDGNCA